VKRDDLTGSVLSGNKIRKLEFILADARAKGADTVITCGGLQSNHCRATALAAAGVGLRSVLFLRGQPEPVADGNVLLDLLAGARLVHITREQYSQERNQLMAAEAARLEREEGARPYVLPEGGSNALGAWGYIEAVRELHGQLGHAPDVLVCATGSGGTQAGLILGCKLYSPSTQVIGVNVCDDEAYFKRVIGTILADWQARWGSLGLSEADVHMADGWVGRGYALNTPEELAVLVETARNSGLVLDPVYTLKGFLGLRGEAARHRFKAGAHVIFFHTGGVFGLFPKREELAPLL
jgi:D-cysteine desulfhydrase